MATSFDFIAEHIINAIKIKIENCKWEKQLEGEQFVGRARNRFPANIVKYNENTLIVNAVD